MSIKSWLCSFLFCFFLAGCASAPALVTFDLSALHERDFAQKPRHRLPGPLVVNEPEALGILDSDRIVVRAENTTLSYLKSSQWSARLPVLVQERLVESFENTHFLRLVSRPREGLTPHYRLITTLRRFEIDALTNEAVIEISAKVTRERDGQVIKGRVFMTHVSTATAKVELASSTQALDRALAQVIHDIILWVSF